MITYRDAVFSDLAVIVDIYNSTVASGVVTADTEIVTVQSREQWFYQHQPGSRPLWLAEINGAVVGWVSFQSFYNRPAYHYTAEISIYLHTDFRGKGLGQEVLHYAMQCCGQLEIKTLLGFIFAHNHASLNLFMKAGFQEWAFLPNIASLHGSERSLKILGKRILP